MPGQPIVVGWSTYGSFTETLKKVWKKGEVLKGSYLRLRDTIVQKMPPDQTPRYSLVGKANPAFEGQIPLRSEVRGGAPAKRRELRVGSGEWGVARVARLAVARYRVPGVIGVRRDAFDGRARQD